MVLFVIKWTVTLIAMVMESAMSKTMLIKHLCVCAPRVMMSLSIVLFVCQIETSISSVIVKVQENRYFSKEHMCVQRILVWIRKMKSVVGKVCVTLLSAVSSPY